MTLQSVSRGLTLARVNKNVILIKTSGNSITIRCRCGTEKGGGNFQFDWLSIKRVHVYAILRLLVTHSKRV